MVWLLIKKMLTALLLPPVSSVLLAFAGALWARRGSRFGWWLMGSALLSLLALAWPPVADALLRSLERHPPIAQMQLEQAQVIVVLGAGVYPAAPEYGHDVLSPAALERARYAVHLQQRSGLPLLLSGGAPTGGRTEAEIMQSAVEQELRGRVQWVEAHSLDTVGNAQLSANLLRAHGIDRVALVTHAGHMVRAQEAFAREGLQVLPAPMGYRAGRHRQWMRWLPRAGALADSSQALHEWLGLAVQRLGSAFRRPGSEAPPQE